MALLNLKALFVGVTMTGSVLWAAEYDKSDLIKGQEKLIKPIMEQTMNLLTDTQSIIDSIAEENEKAGKKAHGSLGLHALMKQITSYDQKTEGADRSSRLSDMVQQIRDNAQKIEASDRSLWSRDLLYTYYKIKCDIEFQTELTSRIPLNGQQVPVKSVMEQTMNLLTETGGIIDGLVDRNKITKKVMDFLTMKDDSDLAIKIETERLCKLAEQIDANVKKVEAANKAWWAADLFAMYDKIMSIVQLQTKLIGTVK